jgi:hypothetical protein
LRERFGKNVLTPLISSERGWFGRRAQGVATDIDGFRSRPALADELLSTIEARAMWARYGL